MPSPEPVRTLRLFSGRILVKPTEPPGFSRGGIALPDIAKEKPCEGFALSVSDEPHRWENGQAAAIEVKVGDRVLYGRQAGIQFRVRPGETMVCEGGILEADVTYVILAHNDAFGASE